jgi:hypothetical protein
MPTIATSCIVTEKTTRQNISMDELVSIWDPENQPVREDVRLQEISRTYALEVQNQQQ